MLVSPATYICYTPIRLLAASHSSGIDYLEVDLIKCFFKIITNIMHKYLDTYLLDTTLKTPIPYYSTTHTAVTFFNIKYPWSSLSSKSELESLHL